MRFGWLRKMEVKLIAKTKRGEEALKKMYKEQHNKKTIMFSITTFIESKAPYTLKIVWKGKVIDVLEKTSTGREQMLVGIRPLIPKYKCSEKDIEVV